MASTLLEYAVNSPVSLHSALRALYSLELPMFQSTCIAAVTMLPYFFLRTTVSVGLARREEQREHLED